LREKARASPRATARARVLAIQMVRAEASESALSRARPTATALVVR